MIENLPILIPNTARRDRTIARCHDTLARRRQRLEAIARRKSRKILVLESALLGGFCVIYFMAMAGDIMALYQ